MEYEWDLDKAESNLSKHGISFEDAAETLRDDPYQDENLDVSGDYGEDRSQVLCLHKEGVVLFVVTTEPEEGVCRIISARRAEPDEQRRYFQIRTLQQR
jgi:uncharacterized DUF497 family protein